MVYFTVALVAAVTSAVLNGATAAPLLVPRACVPAAEAFGQARRGFFNSTSDGCPAGQIPASEVPHATPEHPVVRSVPRACVPQAEAFDQARRGFFGSTSDGCPAGQIPASDVPHATPEHPVV